MSAMQNDQMLSDLRAKNHIYYLQQAEKLEQSGILTYADLFRALQDESANIELRREACWTIYSLHEKIDGRKAIPLLLKLLNAENYELRRAVTNTLGIWKTQRVASVLIARATNRTLLIHDRIDALYNLDLFNDERLADVFRGIMLDESEDFRLRSQAIEWFPRSENMLDTWIQFLRHENADLRFWAIFRLSSLSRQEQQQALPLLDQIAAYDDALPKAFGWKVSREALRPRENVYAYPYCRQDCSDDECDVMCECSYPMWLISPAPEYWDFQRKYRRWNEDWIYENLPLPAFNLHVDAHWLRNEIDKAWSGVNFDVRQPKPQTYILDWYMQIDGQNLLGGLHRDQYSIVLTGKTEAAYAFAAWYRSIVAQEHTLYLYEWADEGTELTPDITAERINQIIEAREEALRAPRL